MDREIISFDYAMKYMLREKANFDILEGFLTALLNEDITIVELLESESNKENNIAKLSRVDLVAKDSNDVRMIIEIQFDREDDYLERIIWETCKTVTDSLNKSEPYGKIVKVISISILYFNLGTGNGYVYRGATDFKDIGNLDDPQPLKLARNVFPEYYFINVGRFQDVVKTHLDEWIYMFRNSKVPDNPKAKHMDKVQEKLAVLKMSEQELLEYNAYIKEQKIAKSVLATAMADGMAKGMAEGMAKGMAKGMAEGLMEGQAKQSIEIAKKLLTLGSDTSLVVAATGLSLKKIKEIQKSL